MLHIKINDIVIKFLLAGDKFMPEVHLKPPGFTYRVCGPFTENKQKIQRFMKTGDAKYIYRNALDKVYFQHDMAYGDVKYLKRRIQSDKASNDKASNLKYDGCQRGLASVVYKIFDKKAKGGVLKMKLRRINNYLMNFINQLLGNFKKGKCILLFKTIFGC